MARTGSIILLAVTITLAACAPASPTAIPPSQTVVPTSTPTEEPSPTPTETPTPTPVPPTPTPTPVPVYTLSGHVFFDYNGNGLQDEGEPGIEGAPVCIDSLESALCSTSGPDGSYSIADVPAGSHQVYVQSPTDEPATAFRYISLSLAAFQEIGRGIPLTVDGDEDLEVALMQGFLTLPFPAGTEYDVWTWYDLDSREGFVRNWLGESSQLSGQRYDNRIKIFDNHFGIDWLVPEGASFVAPAPGVVKDVEILDVPDYEGDDFMIITLEHLGTGLYTHFGDIELGSIIVSEGDRVERGEYIGRAMIANPGPGDFPLPSMIHEQIQIQRYISWPPVQSELLDLYRGDNNPSFWTEDNTPHFP